MKIEITEKTIKINVDGKLQQFAEGDIVTVSDEVGNLCCAHGWAKDTAGTVATGARVAGVSKLAPASIKQKIK